MPVYRPETGYYKMMKLSKIALITSCAFSFVLVSCQTDRGRALAALEENNIEQLQKVFSDAKAKGKVIHDTSQSSLLYAACESGSPQLVRMVWENINTRVSEGCASSALHLRSKPILELLFEYDPEVTRECANGWLTFINTADFASFLMEHGCDPISGLCSTGDVDVFKVYLQAAGGVDKIPPRSMSLICDRIVSGDHVEMLTCLLEAGLDPDAPLCENGKSVREEIRYSPIPSGMYCRRLMFKKK